MTLVGVLDGLALLLATHSFAPRRVVIRIRPICRHKRLPGTRVYQQLGGNAIVAHLCKWRQLARNADIGSILAARAAGK